MKTKKNGLDYFPFDVDFFEDEKIVCIAGEYGIKGQLIVIRLLCAIYRNGYFIEWNDAVKKKIIMQVQGVSESLLDQMLNRLLRWEVFNKDLFESVRILTSVGIQKRYFYAARARVKKDEYPYLLLDEPRYAKSKNPQSALNKTQSALNIPKINADINKEKEIYIVVENYAREEFLEKFFDDTRRGSLESYCMNLGITIEQLRKYADEVVNEWELAAVEPHCNVSDAFQHLVNQVRKKVVHLKNQQNGNTSTNNAAAGRPCKAGLRAKQPPKPGCGLIE